MAVHAEAKPAESGCATVIAARASGSSEVWARTLRWRDLAWTGQLADGRVLVAFYEAEGRLPGDRLAIAPADPAAFRAMVRRLSDACRGMATDRALVLSGDHAGPHSCYFARYPGLELVEAAEHAPPAEPTRAVVTILAQETPEAELRLLVARDTAANGGGWARPEVAFTVAGAGLKDAGIAAARFALDGAPVEAQHSIALFNDIRLRIRMGSSSSQGDETSDDGFYRSLAASGRATLTLVDRDGSSRAVLNFDVGPALAAARGALDATAWSCTAAAPAPTPVAQWRLAE